MGNICNKKLPKSKEELVSRLEHLIGQFIITFFDVIYLDPTSIYLKWRKHEYYREKLINGVDFMRVVSCVDINIPHVISAIREFINIYEEIHKIYLKLKKILTFEEKRVINIMFCNKFDEYLIYLIHNYSTINMHYDFVLKSLVINSNIIFEF